MTASAAKPRLDSYGDKPALIMGGSGEVVTFAQLDARSKQVAQLLHGAGIRRGDHIAIVMENNARFLEIAWAAQRSGLYYTPVNWHLSPAEASYIVKDCGAKALFTSANVGALTHGLGSDSDAKVRLSIGGNVSGFDSYERAIEAYPARALDEETEGAAMCYSSGTTGKPKGILRPSSYAPFGEGTFAERTLATEYPFSERTVYLSPGPLYHAAPIYWSMATQRFGGTAVIMEKYDPALTLQLIERYRVTMAQFVPTMFVRMLKLPPDERTRHDLSSLKFAIHAAAPCPIWVKEKMLEWWGPIIHEYLGSSEGGMVAIGPEEWMKHKGSVGKPRQFTVHILDKDGKELPRGEAGVIYYEGNARFEYHRDPAKSAEAFDHHGWTTVGDIGYLDDDGYLYLSDRKAHMIISGGVNIYPQEVENVLVEHPKVADAAVIGVPNEEFGEEVKAVVQLAASVVAEPALEQELIAYCRERIAHFKCPRSVDFVAELPRMENGKLLKRLIKDRYWSDHRSRII